MGRRREEKKERKRQRDEEQMKETKSGRGVRGAARGRTALAQLSSGASCFSCEAVTVATRLHWSGMPLQALPRYIVAVDSPADIDVARQLLTGTGVSSLLLCGGFPDFFSFSSTNSIDSIGKISKRVLVLGRPHGIRELNLPVRVSFKLKLLNVHDRMHQLVVRQRWNARCAERCSIIRYWTSALSCGRMLPDI